MSENNTLDMKVEVAENNKEIVPEIYDEMGIIGAATKVTGNITTKGHVTVMGTVKGDISAKGNVIISGSVTGKIKCSNLLFESGVLTGDIEANNLVSINESVTLTGAIICKDITVVGTVLGNITATGKVGLASTAVVKGDIKSAQMGMEMGAKLDGKISIA